jgi:UDP-N-acetylmuramoyl-tripeptide--D-alanyl-D-alanine ligase
VRNWGADKIARAAGARLDHSQLVGHTKDGFGPKSVVIDSREVGPSTLFIGLPGATADGGRFAPQALEAGAWGAIVSPEHEQAALDAHADGAVIVADDPLLALHSLAREYRREIGATTIGVTGSTGKTSTKDILTAVLKPHRRTHKSAENWNTEIGLPLTILAAPEETEVLVLEMAMRGEGQIAELVAIAEPDVGVIVNVGPVHLELLGTIENVAAAKAELIRDLPTTSSYVVPHDEPLLAQHLRKDLQSLTFGPGGDVSLTSFENGIARIDVKGEAVELELPYDQPHNVLNTLAAVAAASLAGVRPEGTVDVQFSSLRGDVVELAGGVEVINDCYNANPMSMRAALDHLAQSDADRRIAILGLMAELGPDAPRFHEEIGAHARELGIDVLVTVGEAALPYTHGFDGETYPVATPEEAGALLTEIARPGDRVLVKGSRSAQLERVLEPETDS